MLVWSIVMFALGAFAFLDSFYDFGGAFRPAYAFLFMLLSLGILVRMKMLMKLQKSENLQQRMEELLVKNAQLQYKLNQAKEVPTNQKASQKISN